MTERTDASRRKPVTPKHPLVGHAFHSIEPDGSTQWQGTIIADASDGYFLVQLFDWIAGPASTQHVIHISELAARHASGWPRFRLFDTLADANSYMDHWRHREQHLGSPAASQAGGGGANADA